MIQEMNKLFCFIILYGIIFISSILYFSIYYLFSSWKNVGFLNFSALLAMFGLFFELFGLSVVAGGISDMNVQIHELILKLPHDSLSAADKMFLVIKTQKELGMTVGNLVVMKRGFFLSLSGTIFTYLLLTNSYFRN